MALGLLKDDALRRRIAAGLRPVLDKAEGQSKLAAKDLRRRLGGADDRRRLLGDPTAKAAVCYWCQSMFRRPSTAEKIRRLKDWRLWASMVTWGIICSAGAFWLQSQQSSTVEIVAWIWGSLLLWPLIIYPVMMRLFRQRRKDS